MDSLGIITGYCVRSFVGCLVNPNIIRLTRALRDSGMMGTGSSKMSIGGEANIVQLAPSVYKDFHGKRG